MGGLKQALAGLLLGSLGMGAAQAADIRSFPSGREGIEIITVYGDLQQGDEKAFVQAALPHDMAIVFFNSDGGNLQAGIEIGKAIRLKGYATAVDDNGVCASACGLAWLGGIRRFASPSASIGFHAAYRTDSGQPRETGVGNALTGAYLSQLGLSQSAIAYVTEAAPESMAWLTPEDARNLGIEVEVLSDSPNEKTSFGRQETKQAATDFRRHSGADIYGFDLANMPVMGLSHQQCEQSCAAQTACRAYTYNRRNSACFLKSGGERLVNNPSSVAGFSAALEPSLRQYSITIYERTDYPGGDYSGLRNMSFEQCLDTCEADSRCRAFTYVRRHQQCWLKSEVIEAKSTKSAISGRKM